MQLILMAENILARYNEQMNELKSREKSLEHELFYIRGEMHKKARQILVEEGKVAGSPGEMLCREHGMPLEEITPNEYDFRTFGCPECRSGEAYECGDCGIVRGIPNESPLPEKVYGPGAKNYICALCGNYLGSDVEIL